MAVAYNSKIVTNGLVMYLDAANPQSYPGSGTTWTDLSGRGNHGTLTNGPTFSTDNKGHIVFDGVNDYVDCGNDSSLQFNAGSVNIWCKWINWGNFVNAYKSIIVKSSAWGLYHRDSSFVIINFGGGYFSFPTLGLQMTVGTWFNVGITFTDASNPSTMGNVIFYVNGQPRGTGHLGIGNQTASVKIAISDTNADQYGNNRIACPMLYNRVLSATEMNQNFNALRGRFGV